MNSLFHFSWFACDLLDDGSRRSSVTEKDIMDTLTDHAQRIADSVLSQPNAGEDLENDVKVFITPFHSPHIPPPQLYPIPEKKSKNKKKQKHSLLNNVINFFRIA